MPLCHLGMFHGAGTIDASVRQAWLPSESDSDLFYSSSFNDSTFANSNTLNETLGRLEDNSRRLREELSHHTDIIVALTEENEGLLISEVKKSLGILCNHVENLEDAVHTVLQQITGDLHSHKVSVPNDRCMKPHWRHPAHRNHRILSLNSLLQTKEILPTVPAKRLRSRSVTSPSECRIPSRLSSRETDEALVQSWLVKRVQSEMAKRHQAEARLTQHRLELNRLQTAEQLLRKQINWYENKLRSLDPAHGLPVDGQPCQVDEHKYDAVQKYLFDSAHVDQLPVTECPHYRGSETNVVLDSFYGNVVSSNHAPSSGSNVGVRCAARYQGDDVPFTYASNFRSATPVNSLRRHLSEPDLVISCCRDLSSRPLNPQLPLNDTLTLDVVTATASPSQRASSAKCYLTHKSLTARKNRRYFVVREQLQRIMRKNIRPNAESLVRMDNYVPMQKLVRFLRRSNALMQRLLSWEQHGVHKKNYLLDSVFDFGKALEQFCTFVFLHTTDQQIYPESCKMSTLPTGLYQLIRSSIEAVEHDEMDDRLVTLKQRRLSCSLEHLTSLISEKRDDFDHPMSDVWQRVDPSLLSREDCCITESLAEALLTRLNMTRKRLQQQMEQCNELEALLAEKDARIIAQANELSEVEAHLAASTQTVASLHKQLNSSQHNWTQILQQIQTRDESITNQQLPAIPAVLDLVSSLDAAYADLQESERCRLLAEQRAFSAQSTARRLRMQLRNISETAIDPVTSIVDLIKPVTETVLFYNEQATQTEFDRLRDRYSSYQSSVNCHVKKPVLCDVSVQNCAPNEGSLRFASGNQITLCDEILKFGLIKPQTALEHSLHSQSDVEKNAVLREALRNAMAQVDRLQKYRTTQKARFEQLQQRFSQMSCELDATVDALRHHQTSSEIERRRCAVELAQLRTQLAKATTLLEHYKLMPGKTHASYGVTSLERNLSVMRASSASPVSLRASTTAKDHPDLLFPTNSNDLALQLSMTQSELAQLRSDMTEQKTAADRELTNLRGQLAEATADVRSLRLQVARLQSVSSSNGRGDVSVTSAFTSDAPCTNCSRLQRLLDLLQAKTLSGTTQAEEAVGASRNAVSASLDASCQVDFGYEINGVHAKLVNGDNPQLLRQREELDELEKALKHKELELQKENGRLSFEADRLKRRHEALIDGEAKLRKEVELHESQIESQRVGLQNDALQLGRERARLAEERQAIELERNRLHTMQVEFRRKRMEAELLIEMATQEQGNRIIARRDEMQCNSYQQSNVADGSDVESLREQRFTWSSPGGNECAVQTEPSGFSHGDLDRSVAYWFDWLEASLDQLNSAESIESLEPQHPTHRTHLQTRALDSLKNELCKLRARWNVESKLLSNRDPSWEPSQIASIDPAAVTVDQLLKRLRSAEQESQDAIAQLKSSNAEFLTLRERLSHATIERAHLKATVEGLDEQVSQLENCLHERTEELNACRAELAHYTHRVHIPLPKEWPAIGKNIQVLSKNLTASEQLHCALPEATIVTVGPVLDRYVDVQAGIRHCGSMFSQFLARARHRTWELSVCLRSMLQHLGSARSRLRLQSQPRPRLFFGLFVYFILVHFLLLRCWLF